MSGVLTIAIVLLYLYTIVTTISVLLLENRNPVKSIAWVLVLLFLPLLGLLFYLIFGQNYRKHKIINKRSIKSLKNRPHSEFEIANIDTDLMDNNQLNLIKMLYRNADAAGYAYNKIDVLADGEETFEAIFKAIKAATDHIHIEFFIIGNDKISNKLRKLLIEKANAGVRVRMIYDYWGSFVLSRRYLQTLTEAGVYIRPFLPLKIRFGRSKINFRNHRKLIIIDGITAFTGGLNFADRYIYGNELGQWRDTFIKIRGAAVHALQLQFVEDWYFVEHKLIDDKKYFPAPKKYNPNLVQIVSSGPDTDWESIMQGIASAIMSATKYVYIHTPYFMPNDLIANAIYMASMSGVDVRLMIPARSDSRISDASTSSFLGRTMEAGVRVFKYNEGFLHSKAIVIDDFISIVGSANMDERSFTDNFELSAFIYDPATASTLRNHFIVDQKKCNEMSFDEWNNRKRSQKLKESMARLLSPLM